MDVAMDYVDCARQFSSSSCYKRAFDLYIRAFEKNPAMKSHYEPEFRMILIRLNNMLRATNKMEEIFTNYGRAIAAFPDNTHLLNDIGKYLYQYGFYDEAWSHFQKVLRLDSGFVNAEKNLNSVKNLLVERWHFRMLNDKIRNEAYHNAIKQTVIPYKDRVLDLGTGTSLLAMYAAECTPVATTGCDASKTMTKLAEWILHENLKHKEVVILNSMSTDLDYGKIGGKHSVLVTELFDAGLFGEHVLQSLSHAHENLLNSSPRIIPNKAEVFIIGARCDCLKMKYQLNTSIKSSLNISTIHVHILDYEETYDCEDVHLYKDIKYMTEPQSLLKIDFNDHNDIKEKLNRTEPFNLQLKAKEDGEINTVIGWFNLYLTDEITITTDPLSKDRANAWQQAVFFDKLPQTVQENQTMNIEFLMNGGKLTMVNDYNTRITRISPETLRFLNDSEYVNMITKCLGMATVYLGQIADMSQINIVDLCPFPLFGLLMLKRGAQSVTCCAKTVDDKKFFRIVLKANNIDPSKLIILEGDAWSQDIFRDLKYHAIICNIFELCGDVDLRMKEISQYLKTGHLCSGGLFMPFCVTVVGQLVKSHWLDINNRLYDENVSNYKMAMHVNKYQVSQNFCIDFQCLEYTPLTEPITLGEYSTGFGSEVINVTITQTGEADAILCWYNIELIENLGDMSTNKGNCFIDGMVFLANPPVRVVSGGVANILRCIDAEGSFKLMIDVEAT